MSELKEHIFCDIDEVFPRGYCGPLPSHEARPYYLKSEADEVIRHDKYKRCLAMAKMCVERYHYLTNLENYQLTEKEYQQVICDYWDRWANLWLELAEKFKEAK